MSTSLWALFGKAVISPDSTHDPYKHTSILPSTGTSTGGNLHWTNPAFLKKKLINLFFDSVFLSMHKACCPSVSLWDCFTAAEVLKLDGVSQRQIFPTYFSPGGWTVPRFLCANKTHVSTIFQSRCLELWHAHICMWTAHFLTMLLCSGPERTCTRIFFFIRLICSACVWTIWLRGWLEFHTFMLKFHNALQQMRVIGTGRGPWKPFLPGDLRCWLMWPTIDETEAKIQAAVGLNCHTLC